MKLPTRPPIASTMLNPVHLRTLVTVIRTGSFANAGRELGYTGSAVSQQISELERLVRVALFERSARSVCPTPAGHLLAERSREMLGLLRDIEDDLSAIIEGQLGVLRVGSFPTASKTLLPPSFQHFLETHPRVTVQLGEAESDELIEQLRDGQIDLALVHQYDLVPRSIPAGLVRTELLQEDLLLLVPESHWLAGKRLVRWSDLASETWITTRQSTAGAQCLRQLCNQADFEPRVAVRSNDYDVIRALVRAGLGVALVPALCGGAIEGTRSVLRADFEIHRHVSVLHTKERSSPVVAGFLDALRATAQELSSGQIVGCRT